MPKDYTDETLSKVPRRATQLLFGLNDPAIWLMMSTRGRMTEADIAEGNELLTAVLVRGRTPAAPATKPPLEVERDNAKAELNQLDEKLYGRMDGHLESRYPAQWGYIFDDGQLRASGVASEAAQGIKTVLLRLTTLQEGSDPARADFRQADGAAVEYLAKRGIDAAERGRLQGLVDLALGKPGEIGSEPLLTYDPEEKRRRLTALKVWLDEWSAVARAVVTRTDHRIKLGLERRKARKPKARTPGSGSPGS